MLLLFGMPTGKTQQQADAPLPAILPACLLIYLTYHGRWLERKTVANVFWHRKLSKLGRNVRLLHVKIVRPFATGNQTDAADARAICLAV